jgi:glycosyltransferase involved in cell wall biosynthesis
MRWLAAAVPRTGGTTSQTGTTPHRPAAPELRPVAWRTLLRAAARRLLRIARRLACRLAARAELARLLFRHEALAALVVRAASRPSGARPVAVDAARLILARRVRATTNGRMEPTVLVPYVVGDTVEIRPIAQSVAVDTGLAGTAREALRDACARRIGKFSLIFDGNGAARDGLIAEDAYRLHLPPWLAAGLVLAAGDGMPAAPPADAPPPPADPFTVIGAALRHLDLLPLLHDLHRRRTNRTPAAPFDRPHPPARPPAQPCRRSVLFLHQSYYNFKYLAAALRRRGWDALAVNLHPPDSPDSRYFHGEDVNVYSPDPAVFDDRLHALFAEVGERFGIVHCYGVGVLGLFPANWDTEPTHAAIPWDILEWRRRGILIGYTHTGCLDAVSQTAFGAWSPMACGRCPWRGRPDICSDAKNLAWGRKLDMLVDLICLETDPALDFNDSPKAFREPLSMALDPEIWRPDLTPPEHLRRRRTSADEILVYHGVGNYAARTREGRNIKGTHAVVAAIAALREEGVPIRLDFVDNVPSIDNRFVQVQSDIIVDQLNYGRYGATGREGMMLGKPVVARINPWDGDNVPASDCILETPVVHADEDSIKDVLRDLARDPAKRRAIGAASREHALKWWSAPRLAERFERVYDTIRTSGRPPARLVQ